jgi:uncharacterized protein (TIGR02001 family)
MTKKALILGAAISATLMSSAAMADLSGNLGIVSDYYYRGVQQTGSASANGGVDYENDKGISAGVWFADVEGQGPSGNAGSTPAQGIEIDLYASYGGEAGAISYSLGVTHYGYTGDFDTAYDEINVGVGFGDISLDIASGSHDGGAAADDDYTVATLGYAYGNASVAYGAYGSDWGGAWYEFSYGGIDIGGAEAGITIINGDPDENFTGAGTNTTDGTGVVFSLSKSFEL